MRSFVLSFLLLIGMCLPAYAGPTSKHAYSGHGVVINAATLDAASTSFIVENSSPHDGVWAIMIVSVCVTDANNSVTDFDMSCVGNRTSGGSDYIFQECTTASGVCTSDNVSWSKNPSGMTNKCWPWQIRVLGYPIVECTFTETGGLVADTLTAYVDFVTF